jgi:AmmeMemoRadiSam system protein B
MPDTHIPGQLPHGHTRLWIGANGMLPIVLMFYLAANKFNSKRVFLLGPSHHVYLDRCALSGQLKYETPLGDLMLDSSVIEELQRTEAFSKMSLKTDEDEHSLELHLPYIYKMLKL